MSCEGCNEYFDYFRNSCKRLNKDDDCPCSNCLVKIMCSEPNICDDWQVWYNNKTTQEIERIKRKEGTKS